MRVRVCGSLESAEGRALEHGDVLLVLQAPKTVDVVREGELQRDGEGRARLKGELFTGRAWEAPSGDFMRSEVCYCDGQEHGQSTDWYASGQPAVRSTFQHGVREGLEEKWYADGSRRSVALWEHGTCVEIRRWSEGGEIVEEWATPADDPRRTTGRDPARALGLPEN